MSDLISSESEFETPYYTTVMPRNTRKEKWFCNKPLSPVHETTNVVTCDKSIFLQENDISSSDQSIEKKHESLSELGENEDSNESNDDSIADPDFVPESDPESLSEISIDHDKQLEKVKDTQNALNWLDKDENINDDTDEDEILNSSCELTSTTNNVKFTSTKKNQNFCMYCDEKVYNFARHLERNHKSELEVQKLLTFPKLSKERKQILTAIRKKGNYIESSENGKPMRKNVNSNYLPCVYCFGFYSSKNLWKHRKICKNNPKNTASTSAQGDAQNFLVRHLKIDPKLRETVFPRMRADIISMTAKKDYLICAFAARYIKIHREKHFINVASRKMRELAKLLIEAKKKKPEIKDLFHLLRPAYYDDLIVATKTVAKYDSEKDYYKSPTYAINMGTTIKQCCDIAIMQILKRKSNFGKISSAESEEELKTLIKLIEAHWKFDISTQAINDLNVKKWNKISIVPLASDLKLLKEYLVALANNAVNRLNSNQYNEDAYIKLLETVYCRTILLNRKRPGELQRFLLRTYEASLENDSADTYEEFSEAVSDVEKFLMKTFKRVIIRGKRGRGVPVLFTKDVQEHLRILLSLRKNIIKKPNLYLFGNPHTSEPIYGYKVLKKYVLASGAKNPNAITCTRLRKHLATLTQLFNLSESDMEQLASFMGHTLGVHRSSYRLPDDVYQTAKISKLLLLMEKGEAGQFKGKNLDEININLEEDLLTENGNIDDDIENEIEQYEAENGPYERNDTNEMEEAASSSKPDVEKTNKNKKRKLVPWTDEQKKIVMEFFKNNIKSKKPPKRLECEKLKEAHPELLNNKDWLKIKVFIQNKYSKG